MSVYEDEPLRNPMAPPRTQAPSSTKDSPPQKDTDACLSRVPLDKRIAPFPSIVELDDAVNFSTHKQDVFSPQVVETCGRPATMEMKIVPRQTSESNPTVRGDLSFELADGKPRNFISPGIQEPIRLLFQPVAVGQHDAELACTLRWADGKTEQRDVAIRARAFSQSEIPMDRRDKRPRTPAEEKDLGMADIKDVVNENAHLGDIAKRAGIRARDIAGKQRTAMKTVSDHISSFQRQPPPSPMWLKLAEAAVTIGVAGLGGIFAAGFAPKIGSIVGRLGAKGLEALAGNEHIIAGMTEALQEGFSMAANAALPTQPKELQEDPGKHRNAEISTNPRIAFINKQNGILESLATENELLVQKQEIKLRHLLKRNPQLAFDTMSALDNSLKDLAPEADKEQQRSAEIAWIGGVARSAGGKEVLTDPESGENREVTAFSKGYGQPGNESPGLLRIAVAWQLGSDAERAVLKVKSAAIDGISQEIANRLRILVLGDAPIPVRFTVTSIRGTAHITRDEAGRVQVSGAMPVRDEQSTEPNMHRGATVLCQRILSKPLSSWGLSAIHTNDATK